MDRVFRADCALVPWPPSKAQAEKRSQEREQLQQKDSWSGTAQWLGVIEGLQRQMHCQEQEWRMVFASVKKGTDSCVQARQYQTV